MSSKWLYGTALLLSIAVPVSALAEPDNAGFGRKLRPDSSIVNIFGWGKGQKPEFEGSRFASTTRSHPSAVMSIHPRRASHPHSGNRRQSHL
jgi:hypothetical protein